MPSFDYYCPHSGEKARKPQRVMELADLLAKGNAYVVGAEGDHVICPCCKKPIDALKMAKGEYDSALPPAQMVVVVLGWVGVALALHYAIGLDWVWAVLLAMLGATVAMWALAKRRFGRVPDSMT